MSWNHDHHLTIQVICGNIGKFLSGSSHFRTTQPNANKKSFQAELKVTEFKRLAFFFMWPLRPPSVVQV